MKTKTCFKCNRELDVCEFYKHPNMKDGRLGKCKLCTKDDVSKNYHKNKEHYTRYDKERYASDPKRRRAVESRSKEKKKASSMINVRVQRGTMTRGSCEICGKERACGHHEDYAKPLDVVWLCYRHHAQLHGGRFSLWPR